MLFLFSFFLALTLAAPGRAIPDSYYCRTRTLSEEMWARDYQSMHEFQGFLSFTGNLYTTDVSTFDFVKIGTLSGLWYQYFDSDGVLWGETYARGLPGLPPNYLFRISKNTLVPIPGTNRVCQTFSTDSNPAYVYEYPYSEVNPNGFGYSNSAYYYTRPEMLGRVGSGEMFSWDMDFKSAFALIVSITQGNTHVEHYPGLIAYFRYDKLSGLSEAMAQGFIPTATAFNTTRTVKAGLLHLPVEILPAHVRSRVEV